MKEYLAILSIIIIIFLGVAGVMKIHFNHVDKLAMKLTKDPLFQELIMSFKEK